MVTLLIYIYRFIYILLWSIFTSSLVNFAACLRLVPSFSSNGHMRSLAVRSQSTFNFSSTTTVRGFFQGTSPVHKYIMNTVCALQSHSIRPNTIWSILVGCSFSCPISAMYIWNNECLWLPFFTHDYTIPNHYCSRSYLPPAPPLCDTHTHTHNWIH